MSHAKPLHTKFYQYNILVAHSKESPTPTSTITQVSSIPFLDTTIMAMQTPSTSLIESRSVESSLLMEHSSTSSQIFVTTSSKEITSKLQQVFKYSNNSFSAFALYYTEFQYYSLSFIQCVYHQCKGNYEFNFIY